MSSFASIPYSAAVPSLLTYTCRQTERERGAVIKCGSTIKSLQCWLWSAGYISYLTAKHQTHAVTPLEKVLQGAVFYLLARGSLEFKKEKKRTHT